MKEAFIAVFSLILGAIVSLYISRDTIKFSKRADIANSIKEIFIDYRQRIIALDSDKDNNASSLVVESIEETEILIDKLFFYISNRKRKKISKHYDKYKNPYKAHPFEIEHFREFSKDKNITYKQEYMSKKIPDARIKAIKHLETLINDFKRV
jgi:hypothetical protein